MKNNEMVYKDIIFTYGVHNSPKARYDKVLRMHIIDPITGKRMKTIKERQTALEAKDYREVEEVKEYYFKEEPDEKTIGRAALECAKALYSRNETRLLRGLKQNPVGIINSNQMFTRYIDDFMRTQKKTTSATHKEKRRILKNACIELMEKPISKITEKDLNKLFKEKTFLNKRNLIMDFFEYCRNRGAYPGVNPVIAYLENGNKYTAKNGRRTYLKILSHIPSENEMNLHREITSHLDDPEIMAMILIKCCGCSLKDAMFMRWSDIDDFHEHIIIKGNKRNTGSFHTMDRLALFEGSFLINEKRKRLLVEKGNAESIANDYVINRRRGESKDIKSLKNRLRIYIRDMLIKSGLKSEEITAVDPHSRDSGGSGVTLLKKHYSFVLCERCGLTVDSPEHRFMRGMAPEDVTNTYYRSLSDRTSGMKFFATIVRRDDFFLERVDDVPKVELAKSEGATSMKIPSPGSGRRLSISIPETFLQSGTVITISSKFGVIGDVVTKDYLSGADIKVKTQY